MSTAKPKTRHKPTTFFLISFDNGQDYEDHRVSPLFVVRTRKQAEQIVADVKAWVDKKREEIPPHPYWDNDPINHRAAMDDAYFAAINARDMFLDKLKPPHEIAEMVMAVDRHGANSYVHLVITEVPLRP